MDKCIPVPFLQYDTLIKKKTKFSSYIKEIQKGTVAKSYMTSGLLVYDKILAHFFIPILVSPSSYTGMTLKPLPSEFPYIQYEDNFIVFFNSAYGTAPYKIKKNKKSVEISYLTKKNFFLQ
jgi:hypothetical protein